MGADGQSNAGYTIPPGFAINRDFMFLSIAIFGATLYDLIISLTCVGRCV
jgi:hypothetical protein